MKSQFSNAKLLINQKLLYSMRKYFQVIASVAVILLVISGCATYQAQKVGPTPIMTAQREVPEDQLLDVGVLVFESETLSEEKAEDEGTNNDIRQAESHFIPYHLKNTLQQSGQWGAVQVTPAETNSIDLQVKGEILESNGTHLGLKIEVIDATGKRWFKKNYRAEATEVSYGVNRPGRQDAFQNIYNTIANDMAVFKTKLTPEQIGKIRTTAKLKFAEEFAPDAFRGYLVKSKKNTFAIKRLPADDDPMMDRLLKIRVREYMYVDTLNEQYEVYYNTMWASYENWRQLNMSERKAIKEIKRRALTRQIVGTLLIAGAIAAGFGNSGNLVSLQTSMVLIGGQVIQDGFNVSKEAEIHEAAIQELSQSFSGEMKPVVMEFEGKQYELTGSAAEQFKQWRLLLRLIYYVETGFEPNPLPQDSDSDSNNEITE